MPINKNLLRCAICDGAFSDVQQGREGLQRSPITPALLERVASMKDEDINTILDAYAANKKLQLSAQKERLGMQLSAITAQLMAFSPVAAIPVVDAPAPVQEEALGL